MRLIPSAASVLALYAATLIAGVASPVRAATIAVPPVQVNALTHTYAPGSTFPFPIPASSRDSISIGDGNYSGGAAFSVGSIANGDTATIRVQAPTGKKFVVHDPAASLSLSFFWQASSDAISMSGGTFAFENLVGPTPTNTYSFLGVGNAGNTINAQLMYQLTGAIEFTAIDITIPVQSSPAAGARNFGAVQSNSFPAFFAYATGPLNHTVMSIQAIPEPASLGLLAIAGSVLVRRRK